MSNHEEYMTIDQLLAEVKILKAGWGGQTKIKYLVYSGKAISLKSFRGIRINKHGRGKAREHDIELLWHQNRLRDEASTLGEDSKEDGKA